MKTVCPLCGEVDVELNNLELDLPLEHHFHLHHGKTRLSEVGAMAQGGEWDGATHMSYTRLCERLSKLNPDIILMMELQ